MLVIMCILTSASGIKITFVLQQTNLHKRNLIAKDGFTLGKSMNNTHIKSNLLDV
jgi:hypothetical protein